MLIGRIEGFTRDLGRPLDWDEETQGPCASLPIKDIIVGGNNFMESIHEFTPDEITAILNGAKLHLGVSGKTHPVIFTYVL